MALSGDGRWFVNGRWDKPQTASSALNFAASVSIGSGVFGTELRVSRGVSCLNWNGGECASLRLSWRPFAAWVCGASLASFQTRPSIAAHDACEPFLLRL
jgi:hypothetical protein